MNTLQYHGMVVDTILSDMNKPKEIKCCQPDKYEYCQCDCTDCRREDRDHDRWLDGLKENDDND